MLTHQDKDRNLKMVA